MIKCINYTLMSYNYTFISQSNRGLRYLSIQSKINKKNGLIILYKIVIRTLKEEHVPIHIFLPPGGQDISFHWLTTF